MHTIVTPGAAKVIASTAAAKRKPRAPKPTIVTRRVGGRYYSKITLEKPLETRIPGVKHMESPAPAPAKSKAAYVKKVTACDPDIIRIGAAPRAKKGDAVVLAKKLPPAAKRLKKPAKKS